MEPETRRCFDCKMVKALDEFTQQPGSGGNKGRSYRCKPCAREASRRWRAEHPRAPKPPRGRAVSSNERGRIYGRTEKGRRARRINDEKTRERRLAMAREWKRRNRALVLEYERRREVVKAARSVEEISALDVAERDRWICYLCDEVVGEADVALDHIVPLVRGGEHSEDNVALAHRRCNLSKGERYLADFWGLTEPGRVRRATYLDSWSITKVGGT